jgi:cytochrome P450
MDRDEAVRTAYKGVVSLESYLRGLIEARRHEPTDDILSALVHATDDGRSLTERELVSTCSMLLVAGHETTTNLIGSSILAVLRNPDQMALLLEQPGLVDEAVDEFLRYDGPTIQIARLALEDVEMGGQVISKGQVAFGFGSAANHDPTVFRDPDRLDLLRPDKNRHLGFAHGPHYCLGAAIARLESGIAIREVVLRFPSLALATNDLHWMDSLAMRGLTALPVRFAT